MTVGDSASERISAGSEQSHLGLLMAGCLHLPSHIALRDSRAPSWTQAISSLQMNFCLTGRPIWAARLICHLEGQHFQSLRLYDSTNLT
jgi:hypothetical protein